MCAHRGGVRRRGQPGSRRGRRVVRLAGVTMVGLPDASVRESRDRVRSASATPASSSRRTGSPSTWRRPMCGRPARRSTCRSRSAFLRRRARTTRHRMTSPARRAVARRIDSRRARRAADCRRGRRDGLRRHPAAAANAQRGRDRRGPRRLSGVVARPKPSRALNDPAAFAPLRSRPAAGAPPAARDAAGRRSSRTSAGSCCARRALEIAAAGGHNLLLVGPPGAGKTMMARRVPGILPPLTFDEALEVTAVHSVAGLLPPGARPADRAAVPRAASHDLERRAGRRRIAAAARRSQPRASRRAVPRRDARVQPARARSAAAAARGRARTIARAARTAVFPARFMLVGAMNPCPCGFAGDPFARAAARRCRCALSRARLSGPLRDRMDLTVEVPALPARAFSATAGGESSAAVRERG